MYNPGSEKIMDKKEALSQAYVGEAKAALWLKV
jgi:hypothetical protein